MMYAGVWSFDSASYPTKSADRQRLVAEEQKSVDFSKTRSRNSVMRPASAEEAIELSKDGGEVRRLRERDLSRRRENPRTSQRSRLRLDWHRRLHNRRLHSPGVLRGEGGDLAVKAAGGLNVRVATGAAQDGEGNTVILEEPRTIPIDPSAYNLPDLVFIALGHEDGPASGKPPASEDHHPQT